MEKYLPGYKSLINEAEDGSNDFIDTSLTNKLIFCKQCLTKGYFIITNNSKQLIILLNDAKLIIHSIDQIETDFVMAKKTVIYSVEKTMKKLHIQSDLHLIPKKNLYHDK